MARRQKRSDDLERQARKGKQTTLKAFSECVASDAAAQRRCPNALLKSSLAAVLQVFLTSSKAAEARQRRAQINTNPHLRAGHRQWCPARVRHRGNRQVAVDQQRQRCLHASRLSKTPKNNRESRLHGCTWALMCRFLFLFFCAFASVCVTYGATPRAQAEEVKRRGGARVKSIRLETEAEETGER